MSLGIISCIIFFIPLADYLIKSVLISKFDALTRIDTFLPFVKIVRVENFGVAFGFLKNQNLFILASTLIIIAVLGFIVFSKKIIDNFTLLGMSFIIGGGIGNLIDRFTVGYVVDYIKFTFFFFFFNLSDCFICIGIIIIIVKNLKA